MLPWIEAQISHISKTAAANIEQTRSKNKYMVQHFGQLSGEYSNVRMVVTYLPRRFGNRDVSVPASLNLNSNLHVADIPAGPWGA